LEPGAARRSLILGTGNPALKVLAMKKTPLKIVQWTLFLLAVAVLSSGCIWWAPRRHWHPRYYDGGGWHDGYYYR
jgi:hypothetical protein